MKKNHVKILLSLFFLCSFLASAQEGMVEGTVRGSDGIPLPGVNIIVKGKTTGTLSDFDGNYTIKATSSDILVFSFVGFESKQVPVMDKVKINVTLQEDVSALEEVVVVGFGTQSRQNITTSVASISADQIAEVPTPSLQSALVGKAAGVQITQLNGKIEGGVKVRVRGIASISASQEPLYVLDGIPINNTNESRNGAPLNPLLSLNPNDIESIDILKDASSAAIYGARGTNGVIIITTKKGKQGKTRVSLNSSFGISSATNKIDLLNAAEYVELLSEASVNTTGSTAAAEQDFDRQSNGKDWRNNEIDTDWQDIALREGSVQDLGVNISGGGDKTRFFVSTAYNNTTGIVLGNEMERYTFRVNVDHDISNKFSMGVKTSLAKTIIDRIANDNAFSTPLQSIAQSPLSSPYLEDGETPNAAGLEYYNFLFNEVNARIKNQVWRTFANTYLEYEFIPDVSFRSEFGYDMLSQSNDQFFGSLTNTGNAVGGFGSVSSTQTEKYNFNNYFKVDTAIGDYVDWDMTLGMSFEDEIRRLEFVEGQGFPSDELITLNNASQITAGGSRKDQVNFLSYFGRTGLRINNKYLFKASLRYDGSSRFGKENRFGWFPAASVGWIVSEENFLQGSSFLSLLKFRGSWGRTGNAEIGDFRGLDLFQNSPYNRQGGLVFNQIGNPDLKWERTTQVDGGIDIGFFNNKIKAEVDYYVKNTDELLLAEPVPSTSGETGVFKNIGELRNKGLEVVINTKNISSSNFNWTTSFNISTFDNEITKLPGGDIINSRNIVRKGESISSFYLVEYAGVDPANGDALFIKNTENADGTIDKSTTNDFSEARRIIAGRPFPTLISGLTNTINYKNLDFSFTLQGEWGASIYNGGGIYQSNNAIGRDNQTADQLNRWQQPGDITNVPQVRRGRSNGDQHTTRYLEDADFIRLRNITLGYTLPEDITKKFFVQRCRIYFTGVNLLTFTDFSGYDPESTGDHFGGNNQRVGEAFYSAPAAKTYTMGINVDF
ncbi:TonB-dependent receptor [Aquimarina sp. TRL1]|uniref:SusC/RagA family TonB-linked outer membrane protein n=1 Tax=Aquimarina sp. (strain TRL1) TaxID=2736252 RepID=UPI00158D8C75|nr:TonB-dependent receptor [Aquimarina sp. TRL1]QKX03994.1 TonB-dependent receptor [Aquimarina sp. TRL1]